MYGDSKNDINIIFSPILFACKHYLLELENDTKKYNFNALFKKLLDGFDKLKETYQTNEITYSIDQLKNIVNSFLSNNQEIEINNKLVCNTLFIVAEQNGVLYRSRCVCVTRFVIFIS